MQNTVALKNAILQAAVNLSKQKGFMRVFRVEIAKAAGCVEGTVSYHFGTMRDMRAAIMAHAIEHEVLEVVAQGLAIDYLPTRKAPEALKRKAARILAA
jgi:DNA-binding transcriptional regulator YbjK